MSAPRMAITSFVALSLSNWGLSLTKALDASATKETVTVNVVTMTTESALLKVGEF